MAASSSSSNGILDTLEAGADAIIGAKATAIATKAATPAPAKGTPQAVSTSILGVSLASGGVVIVVIAVIALLVLMKKGK